MGLGVFSPGLGSLCFTFYLAHPAFTGPGLLSRFYHLVHSEGEGAQISDVSKVVACFVAIGLLWVMDGIGGSSEGGIGSSFFQVQLTISSGAENYALMESESGC